MELNTQIKKYRTDLKLSQEELAEKVYVTRQTISNWETGKNYPDIHSLLLLSSLFNISLDQLIKGDIEKMKEEIKKTEIDRFNHYGKIFATLFIVSIISIIPVILWFNIYSIVFFVILYGITMYFAFKVERVKKENNVYTYKEIVAFSDGKRLDEIEKQQEFGKRHYQQILLALGSGLIAFLMCLLGGWLLMH